MGNCSKNSERALFEGLRIFCLSFFHKKVANLPLVFKVDHSSFNPSIFSIYEVKKKFNFLGSNAAKSDQIKLDTEMFERDTVENTNSEEAS